LESWVEDEGRKYPPGSIEFDRAFRKVRKDALKEVLDSIREEDQERRLKRPVISGVPEGVDYRSTSEYIIQDSYYRLIGALRADQEVIPSDAQISLSANESQRFSVKSDLLDGMGNRTRHTETMQSAVLKAVGISDKRMAGSAADYWGQSSMVSAYRKTKDPEKLQTAYLAVRRVMGIDWKDVINGKAEIGTKRAKMESPWDPPSFTNKEPFVVSVDGSRINYAITPVFSSRKAMMSFIDNIPERVKRDLLDKLNVPFDRDTSDLMEDPEVAKFFRLQSTAILQRDGE